VGCLVVIVRERQQIYFGLARENAQEMVRADTISAVRSVRQPVGEK